MFSVLALLHRRPDVSHDEFVEHYERHHVPLILSLAPPPEVYRRHYSASQDAGARFPDVVTELAFDDRAAYESWVGVMYAPGSGVAADEETFLDRGRTVSSEVRSSS